jgi:hypothetical protein
MQKLGFSQNVMGTEEQGIPPSGKQGQMKEIFRSIFICSLFLVQYSLFPRVPKVKNLQSPIAGSLSMFCLIKYLTN